MFRPTRALFYDFHTSPNYPEVGKYFDAEKFTDFLLECGVDFLTFHARCNMGMAYYDTSIGIRHPGLKFDLFGTLAEACARKGIALNAYFNGGLSHAEAVLHPDWETVPPRPFTGGVSPMARKMCCNSPYREHLVAMIEEVVKNYPVKGVFVDCLNPNPCCCERCVAGMTAAGLDPEDEKAMLEFSRRAIGRLTEEISATVKKYIPEPLIYYNCVGFEEQAETGTYLECECIPSRGDWGYEYLPVSARYMRTLGKETCLNMTARFYTWGDFGGLRTAAALKHELLAGLANGLRPNIGDHFPPDGALSPVVTARVKEVYASIRPFEPLFENAAPFAEAAVVFPGTLPQIRHAEEVRGALRLLSELDIQFDIVTTASDWSKYALLIFPDTVRPDREILARIETHLAAGGKIISTGHAGLTEENAFPAGWPVTCLGEAPWDPAFFVFPGPLPDMPFALHAPGILFREKPGTRVFGELRKAYHNKEWFNGYPEFYLPPERENMGPFLAVNSQTAHFSHEIFKSYHAYAMSELRDVLKFALEQIYPEQKVRIGRRPTFLRSCVGVKKNAEILHLFAVIPEQKGTQTQIIEDEITVKNLEIDWRCDGRKVKSVSTPEGPLVFETAGDRIRFTVEEMCGCLPVTIEYR